jgi:sigma-E factor negative regulatory protein RseB
MTVALRFPLLALRCLGVAAVLTSGVPQAMAGDDPRTRLARIHAAAMERNYQGTMVFSTSGMVSSSRVAHFRVNDQSYERIEALDGRQQKIYRHNDAVHTLWPQSNVMVIEKREAMGARAMLMQTVEPGASEQYELRAEGRERVAGREAEVFLLSPRDGLRYAQRLWVDQASGLMLRADVLGAGRQVLESSAFSQIEVGVKPQPESVLQALRSAAGYKVLRAQHEPAQIDAEGWVLKQALPGFRLVSCIKRPLEATGADDPRSSALMLQTVFSDGLTHLSLFVERFDAARHRKEVQGQLGATATLMQRRGEFWLIAMGDVPPATLKLLLDSLERKR